MGICCIQISIDVIEEENYSIHLRQYLPLILQRRHQSRPTDPLLLELLANLWPVFVVWVPDFAEFDPGVFEE